MKELKIFKKQIENKKDNNTFEVYYGYYKQNHFTINYSNKFKDKLNAFITYTNVAYPLVIDLDICKYFVKEVSYINKDNELSNKYVIVLTDLLKDIKEITLQDIQHFDNNTKHNKSLDEIIEEMQNE